MIGLLESGMHPLEVVLKKYKELRWLNMHDGNDHWPYQWNCALCEDTATNKLSCGDCSYFQRFGDCNFRGAPYTMMMQAIKVSDENEFNFYRLKIVEQIMELISIYCGEEHGMGRSKKDI